MNLIESFAEVVENGVVKRDDGLRTDAVKLVEKIRPSISVYGRFSHYSGREE